MQWALKQQRVIPVSFLAGQQQIKYPSQIRRTEELSNQPANQPTNQHVKIQITNYIKTRIRSGAIPDVPNSRVRTTKRHLPPAPPRPPRMH